MSQLSTSNIITTEEIYDAQQSENCPSATTPTTTPTSKTPFDPKENDELTEQDFDILFGRKPEASAESRPSNDNETSKYQTGKATSSRIIEPTVTLTGIQDDMRDKFDTYKPILEALLGDDMSTLELYNSYLGFVNELPFDDEQKREMLAIRQAKIDALNLLLEKVDWVRETVAVLKKRTLSVRKRALEEEKASNTLTEKEIVEGLVFSVSYREQMGKTGVRDCYREALEEIDAMEEDVPENEKEKRDDQLVVQTVMETGHSTFKCTASVTDLNSPASTQVGYFIPVNSMRNICETMKKQADAIADMSKTIKLLTANATKKVYNLIDNSQKLCQVVDKCMDSAALLTTIIDSNDLLYTQLFRMFANPLLHGTNAQIESFIKKNELGAAVNSKEAILKDLKLQISETISNIYKRYYQGSEGAISHKDTSEHCLCMSTRCKICMEQIESISASRLKMVMNVKKNLDKKLEDPDQKPSNEGDEDSNNNNNNNNARDTKTRKPESSSKKTLRSNEDDKKNKKRPASHIASDDEEDDNNNEKAKDKKKKEKKDTTKSKSSEEDKNPRPKKKQKKTHATSSENSDIESSVADATSNKK